MDITTSLIVIAIIYAVLLFFDNFFKTCAHYPYIKFLEGTGFKISLFSIKWETKAFNRTLIRWGNSKPRFFNYWFNLGLYGTFLLLPVGIILLLYSVYQNFVTSGPKEDIILQPVVPGLNLPSSELWYYSGTLIVSSIVHELGHALSAVLDDVNILEVGTNVFFILPVAYVNLSTDKLFSLDNKRTLRIFCAGVWHNIVLSLGALIIYLLLPTLFRAFFHVNEGVTITHILKNSPILGSKGLNEGDIIYNINSCKVRDCESWYNCLNEVKSNQIAFCIDPDLIHRLDESTPLRHSENGNLDCCDGTKLQNVCFEYLDSRDDGILELPSHACLPARRVLEESPNNCIQAPHECPTNKYCFRPLPGNFTYLMKLTCKHKMVIYLGHPSDISGTTEVSSFITKLFFTDTSIPDVVTKFLRNLSIVSFGLALVNVMPFVYMDGQYIIEIIVYMLFRENFGNKKCKLAVGIITTFFTLLLIVHCLYFFYRIL